MQTAIAALHGLLSENDVKAIEVMEKMHEAGFSAATTRRAKQELAVQSIKQSDHRWVWHLPEADLSEAE